MTKRPPLIKRIDDSEDRVHDTFCEGRISERRGTDVMLSGETLESCKAHLLQSTALTTW